MLKHVHIFIERYTIKEKGIKAAVALNPATSLTVLDYVLEDVDMVLIMTVNPGFGGQSFIKSMIGKIESLKKMVDEKKLIIDIEVDGGINKDNVSGVINAGANVIVAGSAVYKSKDIREAIDNLRGTR